MLELYPDSWFPDQNVVSVEGMNPNGTNNSNRVNAFDDIKMVLDGDGRIIGGPVGRHDATWRVLDRASDGERWRVHHQLGAAELLEFW